MNRFISGFLFNSHRVRQDLARLEWIPIAKTAVIVNPAPKKRIEQGLSNPLCREQIGVCDQDSIVGIVGTIREVKDHETFIRAARLVIDRLPNTTFLIVGQDERGEAMRLKELARQLGVADKIRWLGVFSNPLSVMRLFDVAVLCSRSEGLSNTLIEYAAAGIATVATDVGGNAEIVQNGVSGFLVNARRPAELAERIGRLLTDPVLRLSFGLAGRVKIARDFDEDMVVGAYLTYYRQLLGFGDDSTSGAS